MLHWEILGELCAKDSDLWHDLDPDLPRPDLSQILKLILRAQNWYIPMRLDEISTMVADVFLYLNQISSCSQKKNYFADVIGIGTFGT